MSNTDRALSYVKCKAPIFAPAPGGKSINFTDTLTPYNVQPDKQLALTYQDQGVLAVTKSGVEVFIPMSNIVSMVFAKA